MVGAGHPLAMPKKQKRTEQEIHAVILTDVKIRPGCQDLEPEVAS